jgi:glycosyltransferase involved in cell wall biosynthesis
MRIAQIAPLHEAVPPKLYGGTERVVSYLTEELVALGHQVTLFASGDSVTSACLHSVCPRSLRLDPAMRDVIAPHMLMMEEVRRRAEDFDVLHFHLDYWPFSIFTRQKVPFVTTLHGRLDLPDLKPIFNAFRDVPVVSISDSQRLALPQAGFVATVPHGVAGHEALVLHDEAGQSVFNNFRDRTTIVRSPVCHSSLLRSSPSRMAPASRSASTGQRRRRGRQVSRGRRSPRSSQRLDHPASAVLPHRSSVGRPCLP